MTFQIHSEKKIGVSCLVTYSPYCQLATSGHHISPVSSWEVLRLYTRLGTRQLGQKYDGSSQQMKCEAAYAAQLPCCWWP